MKENPTSKTLFRKQRPTKYSKHSPLAAVRLTLSQYSIKSLGTKKKGAAIDTVMSSSGAAGGGCTTTFQSGLAGRANLRLFTAVVCTPPLARRTIKYMHSCVDLEQKDVDVLKNDLDAAGVAAEGMRHEAQQKERLLAQVTTAACVGLCFVEYMLKPATHRRFE